MSGVRCPVCGELSKKCYRCSNCGRDLTSEDSTEGFYDV